MDSRGKLLDRGASVMSRAQRWRAVQDPESQYFCRRFHATSYICWDWHIILIAICQSIIFETCLTSLKLFSCTSFPNGNYTRQQCSYMAYINSNTTNHVIFRKIRNGQFGLDQYQLYLYSEYRLLVEQNS